MISRIEALFKKSWRLLASGKAQDSSTTPDHARYPARRIGAAVLFSFAICLVPLGPLSAQETDLECAPPGCVGSDDLADGAVTSSKLANNSIGTVKLGDSAIGTARLADGAITEPKIIDGIVSGDMLAMGAITTPKLADGAVTAAKLAAGAVGPGAIAPGAVTASAVAADAVGSAALVPAGVGLEDLSTEVLDAVSAGIANPPDDGMAYLRRDGAWVPRGTPNAQRTVTVDCIGGTGDYGSLQQAIDAEGSFTRYRLLSDCANDPGTITVDSLESVVIEGGVDGECLAPGNRPSISVASVSGLDPYSLGIWVSRDIHLISVQIGPSLSAGIYTSSSQGSMRCVTIAENPLYYGLVVVSASADWEVIDSDVRDNGYFGISVADGARLRITGGSVTGNRLDGIRIRKQGRVELSGVTLSGNQQSATARSVGDAISVGSGSELVTRDSDLSQDSAAFPLVAVDGLSQWRDSGSSLSAAPGGLAYRLSDASSAVLAPASTGPGELVNASRLDLRDPLSLSPAPNFGALTVSMGGHALVSARSFAGFSNCDGANFSYCSFTQIVGP